MQKMHIASADKPTAFYSLDVIISVGYRVKSRRGVQFRQWATRVLREHLVRGYTLIGISLRSAGSPKPGRRSICSHARSPTRRSWTTRAAPFWT